MYEPTAARNAPREPEGKRKVSLPEGGLFHPDGSQGLFPSFQTPDGFADFRGFFTQDCYVPFTAPEVLSQSSLHGKLHEILLRLQIGLIERDVLSFSQTPHGADILRSPLKLFHESCRVGEFLQQF